ncbi:PAS domain S-box protein [Rubellimicrobium rubrum]|uniref:histidine kinase n=1 Tax=Rubellimicrobium rubrum TaxID=2585369 RepID=A0A5C4MSL2_9RHOB|nr:PAS domain-containing protein [Rubellimicrobium rubrum]TNC48556.1 PAS domain S-box protein [Rubellimicrobium rubrum]
MDDAVRPLGGELAFFVGGGQMGALMRTHDWSASPLGWPSDWPQSLRSVVGLLLGSKFPMFVAWGPELGFLYNDAYAEILGAKHPDALGARFHDIWSEIWPDISPLIDAALAGEGTYREDLPLVVNRKGFDEQTWFTFSYSPVRDESGRVAGMFCSVAETTARVLAERRTASERERLAGMFEQAPSFMAMLRGPEHIFDLVNAAYMQLIGHRDVLGQRVRDALPEIQGQGFFELLDKVYAAGEPFVGHALPADLQRTPGGPIERRFVDLVYQPIKDAAGAVTDIFVDGSDVTDRVQSETALTEREQELRTLTDALPVLVSYIDAERRYRFVNKIYETWFLRRREDIVGKTVREVVGEAAYAKVAQHMDNALRGERVTFDQFMPYADTTGRHIEVEFIPRKAPDDRIEGFYALVQDVTARKVAEAALHELNETLAQRVAERTAEREALARIVETTGASVQALDLEYRWTAINEAAIRDYQDLYGVRPSVGASLRDLLAGRPDEWTAAKAAWDRALGGESYSETAEWGGAERERRVYEMRFEVLRDGAGEVTGAFLTGNDVSDRVHAQAALAEAEAARRATDALYRAFFESTPEALFVIGVEPDGGFVVEEINPAHEVSLGWKAEDIRGRRIADILPPDLADQVQAHYRRAIETGEIEQWRETYELQGEAQHWDSSLVPLKGSDGRVVRLLGSSRNVTRQVTTEDALRQSQKMEAMGQLTGGVAHDFNNLLTPIVAVLDRLRRRPSGDEREQRLIEGAAQSAERARTLVQRLLAFARRQPLQPTAVDVGSLLRGMTDLVASTTGPQIRVALEVAPDLPPARSDANQLEMAILNLAVNARDAMPDGGTLRLSALVEEVRGPGAVRPRLPPGRYVRLSVADTGTGMDEATLARAVEPFFSTKGVGKGTGLGLSMVHGLASQLGGALEIRSRPGLGTHVELWLPESREAAGATPAIPAPGPIGRRGTVLIVDDEETVRLSTADMLGELGFRVAEVASAEEALRLVERGTPFDLLITDHLMPGINGSDLARRLKALRPSLPVLIISGYAESEGIEPDLPRLSKPFRKDELEVALVELMGAGSA